MFFLLRGFVLLLALVGWLIMPRKVCCQDCGKSMDKKCQFCPACGIENTEPVHAERNRCKCGQCHGALAKFCGRCGADLRPMMDSECKITPGKLLRFPRRDQTIH